MTRQRLTAQQWQALMDQQRSSGMTIARFCDHHGLAVSTFFVWRRKLSEPDAPTFVELTHEAASASVDAPIELVLTGDVLVRVHAGFDAALLRQVVEALR
jgi:transposase-like protein